MATATTSTAHTPGPWHTYRDRNAIRIKADNQHTIGTFQVAEIPAHRRGSHRGEQVSYYFEQHAEADARLIAAAPDLLAACQAMLPECDDCECHWPDGSPDQPIIPGAKCPHDLIRAAIAKATS